MTDPQREHALKVARELRPHPFAHAATWQHNETLLCDCGKVFNETDEHDYHVLEIVADLLLEFAREARLDEANWWYVVQGTVAENERITQLQTPQPAKKGTQQ